MTDIVERLRACCGIQSGDPDCCCLDAADEIVRLREELRAVLAHVVELRAEIEQLRGTEVLATNERGA